MFREYFHFSVVFDDGNAATLCVVEGIPKIAALAGPESVYNGSVPFNFYIQLFSCKCV